MNIKILATVLFVAAGFVLPAEPSRAQSYGSSSWNRDISLTCESQDQRYQLCRVDLGPRGTARIDKRLSKADCRRGQSWGFNRAGVWVDRGCRARFIVSRRGGGYQPGYDNGYRPNPGWNSQPIRLTCASNDQRYQMCRVDLGHRGTARMEEQLSRARCIRGQTWGYNRAGVWVDQGCRARFVVIRDRNDHGYRPGGNGHGPSYPGQTIRLTCESDDQRYQMCRVDLGRNGTARIEQQLSKARCIRGQSWGYNRAGVWVDRGCRARFAVNRRR